MKITAPSLIRLFATICVSLTALPVWGATFTWINTSGGNWNVAGNWNSNQVPGVADTAQFTTPGTYVVNVTDSEGVANLTIGGASGTVTLQVGGGGVLTTAGGTLASTGVLTVADGGVLNLNSGFSLDAPLTNAGTVNLTNTSITLNNNNTTTSGGIVNQGQVNFYGASGDHINVVGYGYEYMSNQGTVNVLAGTGLSSIAGYSGVLDGTYNAALGTTLQFSGGTAANPLKVGGGPELNGPGQYQFSSGYLLLMQDVIPNLPLTASGSFLELGPAFQQGGAITNLTLGGVTLVAGTYQVNGLLIVTNNSTLNGAITVNSGGTLNESTATLAVNSSVTIQSGAALNLTANFAIDSPVTNLGTINLTNATFTINNNNTSTSGGIVNQGQINFYGASGDHIDAVGYGYEYMLNQGTVNVLSGTGISSITAYIGVLEGTYNAAMGTTLQFYGGSAANPVTVGAPPQLNGPGQYQLTSGYLLLTESVIPNLPLTASGTYLELGPTFQQGGAITNLTLAGITLVAGTYQVVGTLIVTNNSTVNGAITVNSGGVLDDSGGMTLGPNSSLTIQSGGLLNLTSGFSLDGPVTNLGTINLTNATITINNNNTTTSGGIVNEGQINFYGASGDHIDAVGYGYEYMLNQGTLNVMSNTGISSITAYIGVFEGIYNAAMGTTLQFSGGTAASPVTVGTPPQLNGPGQYQLTSGYLLLTESVIPNLPLTASGSYLELGPAFQQGGAITNLTLGGITLVAGNYQVIGTLIVTNNSTVNGAITVNSGGALDDSGGMTLAAGASLTIQNGGALNLTSGFSLDGPVTNLGAINLTNATITINNNNTTTSGGIVNEGQINFYGASGDHIDSVGYGYEYMLNQGTLNVMSNTGSSSITAYVGPLEGTYNAAAGTTLQFSGGTAANPITVGTPPILNGPGQFAFTSGYLLFTEDQIPNLALTGSGSYLELGPAFQQGGAITNLTLGGIGLVAGTYHVNGTLIATNNSFLYGAITVNAGGQLDQSSATLAPTGSLTIQGGGSLNLTSSLTLNGPVTNLGTINLTNTTITINNNNTTTSGGIVNEGQINFYGASGDHINSVGYGYEYLINQGTISQRPGAGGSSINPSIFTDPGTLDSQEGVLTLNTINLQPSSVLNFGLNSPTDYGTIAVTKSAALGGTVSANLNNGFVPATGDMFKVLTYSSYSGIFAQTNLPSGATGHGSYSPTFFSLTITGASTATNEPVLTIARVGANTVAISWPIAGGNFNLQTSASLSAGSWSDITSGITTVGANFVLNYTVSDEPAFFRLQSP